MGEPLISRRGRCAVREQLAEYDKKILRIDLVPNPDKNLGDCSLSLSMQGGLHLHRLDGKQDVSCLDRLAGVPRYVAPPEAECGVVLREARQGGVRSRLI